MDFDVERHLLRAIAANFLSLGADKTRDFIYRDELEIDDELVDLPDGTMVQISIKRVSREEIIKKFAKKTGKVGIDLGRVESYDPGPLEIRLKQDDLV